MSYSIPMLLVGYLSCMLVVMFTTCNLDNCCCTLHGCNVVLIEYKCFAQTYMVFYVSAFFVYLLDATCM
jgi:hypothetical protein